MRSEFEATPGALRTAWVWVLGYVLHERVADWRVGLQMATLPCELTTDYAWYEALRQESLDHEAIANESGDSTIRADARRSVIEYYSERSFYRITGLGNQPVARYSGDALATLAAGGGWVGVRYEHATLVFPELQHGYTRIDMIDKMSAIANAIASLPRDQREGTTNALIVVYTELAGDLAADLAEMCDYVETANGPRLSMAGHEVAATNNHPRYSMLAVFLAAARLGRISLTTRGLCETWTVKAVAYAGRVIAPTSCISKPHVDRQRRVESAVSRLWIHIRLADETGTDEAIQPAQRAFHRFIDEEVQGICWRTRDPAVLWAVSAAMFVAMCQVDGMAELLLRGESFKPLYVESEGYEQVWLNEIYKLNRYADRLNVSE
jgi:hypothetical protein